MSVEARRVSDVMQSEVVTLDASDRLDLADDVMRLGRVRHIPVLADGRVVGIVTQRDLLAASLSKALEFDPRQRRTFMHSIDVGEVMSREVVTVAADARLGEAAALLLGRRIGCLPVVKPDGTLVGLVTETDLLRAAFLSEEEAIDAEVVGEG
jgi:CBS domain-containing protein